MRSLAALMSCVLFLGLTATVHAQEGADRLIGTWSAKLEVDEAKLKKLLVDSGVPEQAMEQTMKQVKSQLDNVVVTIVFNKDGTSVSSVKGMPGQAPEPEKSKWKVLESKGKMLKIETTDEEKNKETLTLNFENKDKFSLSVKELEQAPLKTPVFSRKKKE